MRGDHIIDLLERGRFASWSEEERSRIETHAESCPACRNAYEASRVSALLLEARVGVVIPPSPFFQTRVMAALREQQAASEGDVLRRLWRAAGALVSAMVMSVLLLIGVTYVRSFP